MIDKFGKKIVSIKNDTPDLEFMLKEISFFMKGFRKECDDRKAYSIAEQIKRYMKAEGSYDSVYDYLPELEEYTKGTKNESFVWELVCIRRLYAERDIDRQEYEQAYQHRYKAAQHMEIICKLLPSRHNQSIRVWEYAVAGLYFLNTKRFGEVRREIEKVISYTEDLMEITEHNDNAVYYDSGRLTYYNKYQFMKLAKLDRGKECLDCLKMLTYYARELYRVERKEALYLKWVAQYYDIASKYKDFISRSETENIEKVCRWAEEMASSGIKTVVEPLEKLKILKDYYKAVTG